MCLLKFLFCFVHFMVLNFLCYKHVEAQALTAVPMLFVDNVKLMSDKVCFLFYFYSFKYQSWNHMMDSKAILEFFSMVC